MKNSLPRRRFLALGGAGLAAAGLPAVGPRAAAVRDLRTAYDSRQRFRSRGELLDDFEDLSRWRAGNGLFTGSEDAFAGGQSAQLEVRRSYTTDRGVVTRPFPEGLDLSDRDLSLAVRLASPAAEQLELRLDAPDSDNQVVMERGSVHENTGWFRVDFGVTGESGTPDLSDVRRLALRVDLDEDAERDLRVRFDDLRATPKADTGLVVFQFDRAHSSQFEVARPILAEHDVPAFAAVNHGELGEPETMTRSQVTALADAGWEIGTATPHHTDLTELSAAERRDTLEAGKQWLLDNGYEAGASALVYPWGAASAETLEVATDYHYLGFLGGDNPHGAALTDPMTVSRVTPDDVDDLPGLLDLVAKHRQLVVLSYGIVTGDAQSLRETVRAVAENPDLQAITPSDLLARLNGEATTTASGNATATTRTSTAGGGSGPATGTTTGNTTAGTTTTGQDGFGPLPAVGAAAAATLAALARRAHTSRRGDKPGDDR